MRRPPRPSHRTRFLCPGQSRPVTHEAMKTEENQWSSWLVLSETQQRLHGFMPSCVTEKLWQTLAVRRARDAFLRDDAGHQMMRRHIEGGVPHTRTLRREPRWPE